MVSTSVKIAIIVLIVILFAFVYYKYAAQPTPLSVTTPTSSTTPNVQPTPIQVPTPTPYVQPTQVPTPYVQPTPTPVTTQVPTTYVPPAPVPTPQWCKSGYYCDGVPIPQSEAGVGATVCGGNSKVYTCMGPDSLSTNPYWKIIDGICTGMVHACQSVLPTSTPVINQQWCKSGYYCDGVPIPQSEAGVGAIVCGGNSKVYTCMGPDSLSANPYWKIINGTCTGMVHKC